MNGPSIRGCNSTNRHSFWRLGCFIMHRYFSSAKPQDGLYHQRQAILRNSDTAHDGILRLLASMFAWRSSHRAREPVFRLLPVIVTAFTVSAAFGVASVFSSNVTRETINQVLLKGTRCGHYTLEKLTNLEQHFTLFMPYRTEMASKFLNYGMQCYTDETHTDGCNLYVKPRLPLVSTRGKSCPFGADICKIRDDSLFMDTGMLDSLEHFGINIAPEYRFQLRLVTTCAPLKTQGYMSDYNDSEYGAVKRYMYGPSMSYPFGNNFTYQVPVDHAFMPSEASFASIHPLQYQLGATESIATSSEGDVSRSSIWKPIPALRVPNAEVHILFMSASKIRYAAPITDPWFSAQRPLTDQKIVGGSGGNTGTLCMVARRATWRDGMRTTSSVLQSKFTRERALRATQRHL